MIAYLAAAAIAAAASSPTTLDEAAHAIDVHRFEEARLILTTAQANGVAGPRLDHLLADLAFERRQYPQAELRYAALHEKEPSNAEIAERAAIAAFQSGHMQASHRFAQIATSLPGASWKAWNVAGVLCDFSADWGCADKAFDAAARLSPGEAAVLNNEGWSHALRGDWSEARDLFRQAAARDPKSERIANNLDLAEAAVGEDLPHRRANESPAQFAARLNDAGVVASERGERGRAIAAFSRALGESGSWYARAANNLTEMSEK